MAFPSRGLAGFSRTSIAAPWDLEPEKELEQIFPMRACSSPYDQYRNVVAVLLTYFQAPIEAFRGHSRENRGGDTVIRDRWEELVSLASQRGFSSVHGMPRVVVFIFWPSRQKTGFSPFSFYRR